MLKKVAAFIFIMLCCTLAVYAEDDHNGYIFKLKDGIVPINLLSESDGTTECIDSDRNLYKTSDGQMTEELKASDIIEYVEPDYKVYLTDYEVNDAYYNNEANNLNWPQKLINCDSAWNKGLFGQNVRIGVIDSGVVTAKDSARPVNFSDFNINVDNGYDYIQDSQTMTDEIGHGTAIVQIIASQNNYDYFIGVAPRSTIIPLRIVKNSYTYVSDVIPVIKAAVDEYNCDILNMSFTLGTKYSQALKDELDIACSKGVILVAAAGNDGDDETKGTYTYYPAGYENVISVGSVNANKEYSDFSQRNSSVFCCAPGEDIYAYYISGSNWALCRIKGTSFSAPVVCGVAALLKGVNPSLNQEQFMDIIKNTAINLGDDDGRDEKFGFGLIDVDKAIEYMLTDSDTFVSPVYYDYTDTNITVTNNSDKAESYTSIWVSNSTDGTKCDTYTIEPGMSHTIWYSFDGTSLKHYLINSFEQLKPMYKPQYSIIDFE